MHDVFWQAQNFLVFCVAVIPFMSVYRKRGPIGTKLQDIPRSSGFFTFFHFEIINQNLLSSGEMAVTLKPGGEAFRSLVTLCATLNRGREIQQLRLKVARGFIAASRNCSCAADLVKSFFAQAPTSDTDQIGSLVREIGARTSNGSLELALSLFENVGWADDK